jgi:hypothetical protein
MIGGNSATPLLAAVRGLTQAEFERAVLATLRELTNELAR